MFKPIVNVKEGRVRGTTVKSVLGPSYIVFHEIPFANPPVGKLRFKVIDISDIKHFEMSFETCRCTQEIMYN